MRTKAFAAQTTIETVKTTVLHLTGVDILKFLRLPEEGSKVEFHVPGGGDYSNAVLPVTSEDPVVVTVQAKTSRTRGGDEPPAAP